MDDTQPAAQAFPQRRLPWIIGGVALVLYLISLNPWLRFGTISVIAELSNWDGLQPFTRPLLWLVTRPLRLLPEAQFPIAANALAAVFGAISVGFLTRIVALLPHDRTKSQRVRGHADDPLLHGSFAWLPPAFAGLLVALQLTFWEQATAQTGEMLDLMLFAGCALCLMEYRASLRETWLWRFAFLYGISIPGNWAMIGFFPLFLIALVWIRGWSILDTSLLLRLVGWGCLGLSVYLLMPAMAAISGEGNYSSFDVLKVILSSQRDAIRGLPRSRFLLLATVNLLPLVLVGIRWSGTKASSSLERIISEGAVILLQLGWLGTTVYMAFDSAFSQRQLIHLDPQYNGIPLLTFHFCGAIAAGYFLGYFLLVGGSEPSKAWDRPSPGLQNLTRLGWIIMIVVGLGAPAALMVRNWPRIQAQNGPHLESFSQAIVQDLPKESSLVFSDNPWVHSLLTAYLIQHPSSSQHLLVNGFLARQPWYRQRLQRIHGSRWAALKEFSSATQDVATRFLALLREAAAMERAFIVAPEVSFITDRFELRPLGLLFRLQPFGDKAVDPTPLSEAENTRIQTFYREKNSALEALRSVQSYALPGLKELSEIWSRQLDFSGVQLQQADRLEPAARLFETALRLNPKNGAAETNLKVNAALQSNKPISEDAVKPLAGRIPIYVLSSDGPVDEPQFLSVIARSFQNSGENFVRSILIYLARAHKLAPDSHTIGTAYAEACKDAGVPDRAMATIHAIKARGGLKPQEASQLLRLEANAILSKGNFQAAETLLLEARRNTPTDPVPLDLLSQLFYQTGRTNQALEMLDTWQALRPNEVSVPLRRANILIELKQYPDALVLVDRALKLQPDNATAREGRASCLIRLGRLEDARKDYEILARKFSDRESYQLALGAIAERKNDKSTAISHYKRYLELAPQDAPEVPQVKARLDQLRNGPRTP